MKKLKTIFCAVFRHSHIQEGFFGFFYCGRCGYELGDTLGGVYSDEKAVVIGHNCKECRANYKKLNWVDKFLAPDPIEEDAC